VSLTGKGILILQLPVNGTICGEMSLQVLKMDVAVVADVVGVS
jgi:hypothetical protein